MISFDGFRWDYLDLMKSKHRETPNFDRLISSGVTTGKGGVKNAFITKTFPNHYSLVTGLYEENHGIVANNFYDPIFNETFEMSNPSSKQRKWWNGTGTHSVEPIWVTNENVGRGGLSMPRASGVVMWPGSDVEGQHAKHFVPYDIHVPLTERIDMMVDWFSDHDSPMNLGLLYFHEPDATGHAFGPDSDEILNMIKTLDEGVGYLIKKLKDHKIFNSINLIITSDHGMAEISENIDLDLIIDPKLYTSYGTTPVLGIYPKDESKTDEVYTTLKGSKNLLVYKTSEIPEDFHYRNNRRIPPILISAPEGYRLCQRSKNESCSDKGNHGYDNSIQSMHPFFIAHGHVFKKNFTTQQQFNNVDIYSLICHVLDIPPQPHDGSLDVIKAILEEDDDEELDITKWTLVALIVCVSIITCVCMIGAIRTYYVFERRRFTKWTKMPPNSMDTMNHDKPLLISDEEEDIA